MREFVYRSIGVIHSCHTVPENTPIQPVFAEGCEGRAELLPEYAEGLSDLDGFSHIYLIYHFHRAKGEVKMRVKPYMESVERGLFAMRSPRRPNPIGISIVRLTGIEGNMLLLDEVDILDGTPLLDIKPYTEKFDVRQGVRSGWQDAIDNETAKNLGKRGYEKPNS